MSASAPQPFIASSVAETLLGALDAAAVRGRAAHLGIPGGRSPGPVLTALAGMLPRRLRAQLHLWWIDERAVPVGDSARNDLPTLAAWQAGGELPGQLHRMPAEAADLEAAASDYAAELARLAPNGLDAVLLGIGEDGHLASLFPQHAALTALDPVLAIYDSPKPPPRRLSLGLSELVRCPNRLVLALGADKGAVYARVREAGPTPTLPVSLLPERGTLWFLDDAALAAARP